MKKLLILFLVSLSLHVQAEDSTKLTVKQVYEDAKSGITHLVDQLGGPAKHVYNVYVRQHIAEGVTGLILWILLALVPIIVFTWTLTKRFNKLEDDSGSITGYGILAIVTGFISLIGVIVTMVNQFEFIQKLINPEYYAIQDIIHAFK